MYSVYSEDRIGFQTKLSMEKQWRNSEDTAMKSLQKNSQTLLDFGSASLDVSVLNAQYKMIVKSKYITFTKGRIEPAEYSFLSF